MFEKLYAHNDALGFALNAYTIRNDVIQHNIANGDTPGFKRKVLDFEAEFARALDKSKRTGSLNLRKASPKVRMVDENFSFRLDGNNVDMELEMVELYKNGIKYDIVSNSVMHNYRKISMVLAGR